MIHSSLPGGQVSLSRPRLQSNASPSFFRPSFSLSLFRELTSNSHNTRSPEAYTSLRGLPSPSSTARAFTTSSPPGRTLRQIRLPRYALHHSSLPLSSCTSTASPTFLPAPDRHSNNGCILSPKGVRGGARVQIQGFGVTVMSRSKGSAWVPEM